MIRAAAVVVVLFTTFTACAKPPPDGVYADLPFLDSTEGVDVNPEHIVLDMAAEGHRALPLMIDTGASFSVLTPGFAKQVGVSVRRTKNSPYRRKSALGRDVQFYVDTSSSDTGARSGWEIGVLGGNVLEKYTVEFDYVARRVRFLDPRKHPVPKEPAHAGEIVVPVQIVGRRPYVVLNLGNGKASFLVDTGAPFDLELSEKTAVRLGISHEEGDIVEGSNAIGADRALVTEVDSVRIGDREVGPSELKVTLADGSGWRHTNNAGRDEAVLAASFLNRFHVRIDYVHSRMSLVPLSAEEREKVVASLEGGATQARKVIDWVPATVRLAKAGLDVTVIELGQFRVDKAKAFGPGSKIGLRKGDVITNASGEKLLTADSIEARIVNGRELTVARESRGIWIDMVLPEPSYTDE